MNKINFKNLPDESTPINAENLNAIQQNVEDEFKKVRKIPTITVSVTPAKDYTLRADTETNVEFDKILYHNSTFLMSQGAIQCPYTGTVLVTASAMFSPRVGYCGITIKKNGSVAADTYWSAGEQKYGAMDLSTRPIDVKQGDFIQMYVKSTAEGDKLITSGRTQMTLMYVDYN